MLQDDYWLLAVLHFLALLVAQQRDLESFLLMMTVVVKLALVLMDFQSILVGPVLLPLQDDSLVDHTGHLLRVPLVEGLQGFVDLVTAIVLSCLQELVTEELFLSLALQVTSQASEIFH